jgi:hypothetical protein
MNKIDRLLGSIYIDETYFEVLWLRSALKNMGSHTKNPLNLSKDRPSLLAEDLILFVKESGKFNKDGFGYFKDSETFLNDISDHLEEIEGEILNIVYYLYNIDDGEFRASSTSEKMRSLIEAESHNSKSEEPYILLYQQDRNLLRLIQGIF